MVGEIRFLLLSQTLLDSLALSLIAWLVEQSEHILLVSLNTRLVEWVDTLDVTRDAASLLEEVDELTEIVLVELRNADADVRNTTIDVSQTRTELSHLVDLTDTLASKEVQTVEVLLIEWEVELTVRSLNRDDCLED